ncbi:MAG: TraE family protein, partial [Erysipelotrichaceae bacterium]|nr:TraE family protein [Erysipelotrichaceae bacterium]
MIPPAEARNEVDNRALGIEKNIADWQRRQNMNNNFSAIVPFTMEQQRKDIQNVLEHITNNDQRMFLAFMSVAHLADSLEELNNDTEHLKSVGQTHGCDFETLFLPSRQLSGLNTVLPYFDNFTGIYRTLLSYSAAAFIPFRLQEIMQKGGIWYGQNKPTDNPIICNKAALKNCNALTIGVPGAG